MYLYIIFILLGVCALLDIYMSRDNRTLRHKLAFFTIVFFLFFISAFRLDRGTDWVSYESYFLYFCNGGVDGWLEWGYTMLNQLVVIFSHNYSVLVFLVSAIIFLIKPRIIYDLSPYPFVALLAWYCISIANIFPVRQTIATAFVLYSFIYVIRRQVVPFLILVFIASTFHLTALIFIPAYYVYNTRLSRFWCLSIFISSFIIALTLSSKFSNLLSTISNPIIQDRIDNYLETGTDSTYGSAYSATQVLLRGFVNRGMIMILIFYVLNDVRLENKIFNWFVNLFLAASCGFALLSSVNVALSRLVLYYDMVQVFIFSYLFTKKMSRQNRLLLFIILTIYLLYRFYGVIYNYYDLYVPYKWLF